MNTGQKYATVIWDFVQIIVQSDFALPFRIYRAVLCAPKEKKHLAFGRHSYNKTPCSISINSSLWELDSSLCVTELCRDTTYFP